MRKDLTLCEVCVFSLGCEYCGDGYECALVNYSDNNVYYGGGTIIFNNVDNILEARR